MAEAQALPPDEPAAGISRTLATWRSAHYREVRYARIVASVELVL
jgi:hypothetical protein